MGYDCNQIGELTILIFKLFQIKILGIFLGNRKKLFSILAD